MSDDKKRQQYDQFGHARESMGGFNAGSQNGMNMNDIFEHFGDIFGDIFSNQQTAQRSNRKKTKITPKQGHDLQKELSIESLEI